MKRFSIRSIFLGIGIGMIITSIANIVFVNNEVMDMGQENQNNFISTVYEQGKLDQDKSKVDTTPNTLDDEEVTMDEEDEETLLDNDYYEIYINKGMNSVEIAALLEREGIITDSKEFNILANKLGIAKVLQFGSKRIPYGSTMEEVLDILVTNN